ncbi:MAG: hypothetical protein P8078_01475 [bacterium]
MKSGNQGFTSVELTIALLISSIIIGFIYTVYHFSLSYSRKWEEKIELENNAFLSMNQITSDMREGMDIFNSGNNYIFVQNSQGNIYYYITVDSLQRNNFTINSESCRVDTFFLGIQTLRSDSSWGKGIINHYSLREEKSDSMWYASDVITLGLKISNEKKSMDLRSSVCMRNRSIARFNRLLGGGYDK